MESNDVAKGTFQITFTDAFQYVIMAAFYIVVAKTNALTPEDLGYLSILSFIASTTTLSLFNLPKAVTKFVSEKLGKKELGTAASIYKTGTRLQVILATIALAIATLLSTTLSQYFWGNAEYSILIVLICLEAFFINLISIYKSGLGALGLFGKMALLTIVYIVVSRGIAIGLALLDFRILGVLIGYVIGSFVGAIVAISFVHGKFQKPENKFPKKSLILFSFPLFLSALTSFIISQVDVVIIASMTSDYGIVGVYSIAVKSLLALNIVWQPIMITIFPLISSKFGLQKRESVSNVVRMTSRYLAYTTIPCCLMLVVIAPTALEVFYGSQYISGASALAILALSTILLSFFTLLTTALTAIGKTNYVLRINIISAVSSIVFLIGLVPLFDIIGAASSRLIAYTLSLIVTIYIIRKFLKIELDKEALWKSTIASLMTIPFLFLLECTLKEFSVIQVLVMEIVIAGLIYLVSLYLLKALNRKDFDLLRQSFPKFFSKIIDIFQRIMQRE
jgi:O-antigen/teichoic acid export membrane protein